MSASLQLGLNIDDKAVSAVLAKAPVAIVRRIVVLITASAIDVQGEERRQAPIAVTGQLRGGVDYVIDEHSLTATIAPRVKYAEDVQYGSGPRKVSVKPGTPLRRWADLKGADPYEVQAAIAKHGTKANPFITRTYNIQLPLVQRSIAAGIDELVGEIDRGSI